PGTAIAATPAATATGISARADQRPRLAMVQPPESARERLRDSQRHGAFKPPPRPVRTWRTDSLVCVEVLDELGGRDTAVRVDEDLANLVPVDRNVEAYADPAAAAHVRGNVEAFRFFVDQLRLHARRRGADQSEPAVTVMVVPDGGERLLA